MTQFARWIAILLACYAALLILLAFFQRRLLYYPTHHPDTGSLTPWTVEGRLVGYCRSVEHPKNVWLFLHGNAGQASDRAYALPCFSAADAVYFLEYPGYGDRPGAPGRTSIDKAAQEGYRWLRKSYPAVPVCVAAESIGSGPACNLAREERPPDKIVLVVPFDNLVSVARHHFPYLPVWLLLFDRWDNVAALRGFRGKLEIYGAKEDRIIPVRHARDLAASVPGAVFHEIPGGHNDWPQPGIVRISN